MLLYACFINLEIVGGFVLQFIDFCKTRCFSGKLAKWAFKLARRAFIAENLGLLAQEASSWLSEKT
jgi:uncharacterized membrane protein